MSLPGATRSASLRACPWLSYSAPSALCGPITNKQMSHESVQEMFSRMAGELGTQTAIEGAGRRVSYGELEAESNRLANFLLEDGVGRGTMVALFSADPIRIITGILGVLKAGAVFVPLDPTFPEQRLRAMSEQVEPQWYVTETKHLEKLERLRGETNARVLCLENWNYENSEP